MCFIYKLYENNKYFIRDYIDGGGIERVDKICNNFQVRKYFCITSKYSLRISRELGPL